MKADLDEPGLTPAEKAVLRQLHDNEAARMLPHNLASALFLALSAAAVWTWSHGLWPLTMLCWALGGHIGHAKLISFHEAAHGTLNTRWWLNELQGIVLGSLFFVPLSVYRYVHGQHHTYLGSPRDLELWPFVIPSTPRFVRRLCAVAELLLGFFYTPLVFGRGVLTAGPLPRGQAARIVAEYAFCGLLWGTIFGVAGAYDGWPVLIVGYFVPVVIAGNLQSLRKFTEHMGLCGGTILSITRTVVDRRWFGRLMSDSMLHIDYHGTHHRYAKVPHYNLPAATPLVYKPGQPAVPIFSSYASAMLDMLRTLHDPRVGRQWLANQDEQLDAA